MLRYCWLHAHRNMGVGLIRSIYEYWRPILDLGNERLTTDQARRTFCTLGNKYTGSKHNYLCRCSSSCPPSS